MERDEIKRIISNNIYNLRSNESFFIKSKLIEYLEKEILKIDDKYKYIRITINDNKTINAHYVSNEFQIYYYTDENFYKNNSYHHTISINIDEMFGNCSTVMVHNIDFDYENTNEPYLKKIIKLFEDIISLFGYTCIMFNLSNEQYENKKLMEILNKDDDYKVISEFKNKRGGYIKYYQKLI